MVWEGYMHMCASSARKYCYGSYPVCVLCVCGSLHRMNEIVTLLNLTWFIYNFYTWLIVMFCLFVNAQYEWNVTMTNSCVRLNVIGD